MGDSGGDTESSPGFRSDSDGSPATQDGADTDDFGVGEPQATDDPSADTGPKTSDAGRREVVVPERLYKTVTVFSTLVAIVSVVVGFWFLTAAGTVVENPTGSLFVGLVRAAGGLTVSEVEPYLSVVALVVGLVGLALVAGGGWVFAMGSRFRSEKMGKPKDEDDEPSGNG